MSTNGKPQVIGSNVEALLNGDILTLRIDLSAPTRPSKSGKTEIISTTSGAAKLAGGETVNLNVYRPRGL